MTLDNLAEVPGSRRKTPIRTVQIDDELWSRLGDLADRAATGRAELIREYVDWVTAEPDLWISTLTIAKRRGETIRGVVLGELRRYVNRNKDRLDDSESR